MCPVMLVALAPLIAFAVSGAEPHDRHDAAAQRANAAEVAQALADADQIVRVHEAPGAIVFDLDRAGELFQLTVASDDDGRVTDSDLDWVGPTDHATGVAPAVLDTIARIELDARRRVILHGGGEVVVTRAATVRG
jgi:hypothetical protein